MADEYLSETDGCPDCDKERQANQLAEIINSKCGISIRNSDSNAIAKTLISIGYGAKSEIAEDILKTIATLEPTLTNKPWFVRLKNIYGVNAD